jgi:hypothetical protein
MAKPEPAEKDFSPLVLLWILLVKHTTANPNVPANTNEPYTK